MIVGSLPYNMNRLLEATVVMIWSYINKIWIELSPKFVHVINVSAFILDMRHVESKAGPDW